MKLFILILVGFLASCASAPAEPETQEVETKEAAVNEHHQHGHHKHHGEDAKKKHDGHHHAFDNPEEWAKRWNTKERAEWQQPADVIAMMDIQAGMTVADLGTGTGFFVPYLAEAVGPEGKVWGLDVEASMVDYVNKNAAEGGLKNVEAKKIPFDSPGVEVGSLDRVLIVNTWHHIDDRLNYSKKLAATLKPGGKVIIVDLTMDSPMGPPKEFRLTADQIIKELAAGGIQAAAVEETLPRQFVVVGSVK